jgi:hypothetical protein
VRFLEWPNPYRQELEWSSSGVGDIGDLLFNGHRVSPWEDGKVLKLEDGGDCTM